ncbi:MAG: hypothetical protein WAV40_00150 [Microgenomates group bacterium]
MSKFSLIPLITGFLVVVIVASILGIVYFKTVFKPTPSPSPTPSPAPSLIASPSPLPSATSKPTKKPASKPVVPSPISSPTPTPVPIPSLDIRFSNPSANVKQTYDDGSGVGRVVNREYSSIQVGQFDEIASAWSPRITVCYHIVSNEEIKGKDVKFVLTLDDKTDVEDNLGQYDKLEAGRTYDWCHDMTNDLGKHKAALTLNGDKSIKEIIYTNDIAKLEWESLRDYIAPNYTLIGPTNEGETGTCLFPQYISDNVTPYASLKIEQQVDSGSWTSFAGSRYCFVGTSGSSHTYKIKITDARGNANEQSKTFVLY